MMPWTKIAELGVAASDGAVEGFIADPESATSVLLGKSYGRALNLDAYPGVDPTGVTECAAAIQDAFDEAASAGLPVVSGAAQYKLASGVVLISDADLSRAVFNFTGTTGVALTIGATAGLSRKIIHTPFVVALAKTVAGWAQVSGTIGIECVNLVNCEVSFQDVRSFETGIQFRAQAPAFVAYNRFFLSGLLNNKRSLVVTADATTFANKNEVFGGDFNYSGEGVAVSGACHILLDETTVPITSWTFRDASIQDSTGTAEFLLRVAGQANRFDNCYFETNVGTLNVRWADGSFDNVIDRGVNSDLIVETVVGSAENRLHRLGRDKVITSSRTVDHTDYDKTLILNGSGAITITLPDVTYVSPGTRVTLRNVASSSASVSTTTDPINGSLSAVTLTQWTSRTFVSQTTPDHQWIMV